MFSSLTFLRKMHNIQSKINLLEVSPCLSVQWPKRFFYFYISQALNGKIKAGY